MSNGLDEAYEELHGTFGNTAPVLRRVLATVLDHLRSPPHPAPTSSPSEENGGEGASDEELERLRIHGAGILPPRERAFYDAGRHRQASADAATVAGLRRVRPAVAWFAEQMEAKLRENDHKGGWSECTVGYLVERLRKETVELEMALDAKPFDGVVREAADVANFAMMLADLCAPKPPTPTTKEG